MRRCESFADDLVLFLAGELDEDRTLCLEEHLRACEACRAEHDEMRATDEALSVAAARTRREASMPATLRRRMAKKLRGRPRVRRAVFLVSAGVAAGLLLAMWLLLPERPAETAPAVFPEPVALVEPSVLDVFARDPFRAISRDIQSLRTERVWRAIPSSALSFVEARVEEDLPAGSLRARRVVERESRIDRELRSIERRIQRVDRNTWYMPARSAQGGPSSGVPALSKKPHCT